tara:strand:- start:205 stop:1113 length:909 start_codon:yes stop_codon:yes gene_type:complete
LIKNVVLIGYGSHAKKRIIPSLNKRNIKIQEIYSKRKSISEILKTKTILKNTVYYICTPPKTHFKIIRFLLLKKLNVIVEKPAVSKLDHLKIIKKKILKNKKNIFLENLMYIHSKIFQRFINYWAKNKKKIVKLEINFLIPRFFKIGFRSNCQDKFLILYDIGIYPISLLNILGIKISKIEISDKIFLKQKLKKIKIKLRSKNLEIQINIGEKSNYINNLVISELNGSKIYFDKIFSGIKVDKKITFINKVKKVYLIKDHDCFVKFFTFNMNYLKSIKKNNIDLIEKNIMLFDRIKSKIKSN